MMNWFDSITCGASPCALINMLSIGLSLAIFVIAITGRFLKSQNKLTNSHIYFAFFLFLMSVDIRTGITLMTICGVFLLYLKSGSSENQEQTLEDIPKKQLADLNLFKNLENPGTKVLAIVIIIFSHLIIALSFAQWRKPDPETLTMILSTFKVGVMYTSGVYFLNWLDKKVNHRYRVVQYFFINVGCVMLAQQAIFAISTLIPILLYQILSIRLTSNPELILIFSLTLVLLYGIMCFIKESKELRQA